MQVLLTRLEPQQQAKRKGHFALYFCFELGHIGHNSIQLVFCEETGLRQSPDGPFWSVHQELRLVYSLIRQILFGLPAYCSYFQRRLAPIKGRSYLIVPSYRRWTSMIQIICDYFNYFDTGNIFLFFLGMDEINQLAFCVGSRLQETSSPDQKYPASFCRKYVSEANVSTFFYCILL